MSVRVANVLETEPYFVPLFFNSIYSQHEFALIIFMIISVKVKLKQNITSKKLPPPCGSYNSNVLVKRGMYVIRHKFKHI